MIVAPVVVKPDIASKNASLIVKGVSDKINGNIPKTENTTHIIAVNKKPSRLAISVRDGSIKVVIEAPTTPVIIVDTKNA
jgi:hypothetical protein